MRNRLKVFTSLTLFYTFLVISVSGMMLYISPKGRIANWTSWTVFGLEKEEWAAIHTVFVAVFLIAGIFHLVTFNWTAFTSYLKRRENEFRYKYEILATTVLFAVTLVGVIASIQPIIGIYTIGEYIKESYEVTEYQPPVPHAEEFTVGRFAREVLRVPTTNLVRNLQQAGYAPLDTTETFGAIARRSDVAPSVIFTAIQTQRTGSSQNTGTASESTAHLAGSGLSWKTLAEACTTLEMPIDTARAKLAARGITNAGSDEVIRDIASRYDMRARDVVEILTAQ